MSNEMVHGNIIGGVGTKTEPNQRFPFSTHLQMNGRVKRKAIDDEDDDKNKRK